MIRRPPSSTLFPCTTLSRSRCRCRCRAQDRTPPAWSGLAGMQVGEVLHGEPVTEDPGAGNHGLADVREVGVVAEDRKSTRLNSSHANISYAVFCLIRQNSTV